MALAAQREAGQGQGMGAVGCGTAALLVRGMARMAREGLAWSPAGRPSAGRPSTGRVGGLGAVGAS